MKLKCRIHEKDYDVNLVAGATFAEEYNETLDSGSIIVDQIKKIKGLVPYDDVYIWNSDQEFHGYANVGDTVAAKDFGATIAQDLYASYLGTRVANIVADTYLQSFFPSVDTIIEDGEPTDRSGLEFKSYKYSLDGKTFPCLIDAWASNFLYTLDRQPTQSSGYPRWNIDDDYKITLKITFSALSGSSLSIIGYYYLPRHKNDGVDSNGRLILRKDTSYTSDSSAPEELHIDYELIEPNQSNYIGTAGSIYMPVRFRLMTGVATSSDGIATPANSYDVSNIEKAAEDHEYCYIYYFDLNSSTYGTPRLVLSFNGMTKEQILAINGLKFVFNAGGYTYVGVSEQPVVDSEDENKINIHFNLDIDYSEPGDGFDLSLEKDANSNTVWSSSEESFFVTWQGEQYPADVIINNIIDNLKIYISNSKLMKNFLPSFFKHFLVDERSWEMLSLEKQKENRLYKCKISLMSETKGLEKVICPNVSITQPIVGQKRSVWYYLNQFVDLYSPKIKVQDEDNKWVYKNKYQVDARSFGDYFIDPNDNTTIFDAEDRYIDIPVHEIFNDRIYAPEMSLTAPTLREILSRLMIVKDCIPIVRNNVIYAMRISETYGNFIINDDNFSFVSDRMNSSNYSTAFRREYGGAISQKNSARLVEFMGFRTSGSGDGLMTLNNMILETRFPIYKINKLYMCYYKMASVKKRDGNTTYGKLVLVKQDITKIVLQSTVRNALPADWTEIIDANNPTPWSSIDEDEMAKHRVLTLGYNIGSNVISGWGENIKYIKDLLGWTSQTYTYIEMVMKVMDSAHPWGINGYNFLESDEQVSSSVLTPSISWEDAMVSKNNSGNVADKLKGLFFEMDYTAMYSGAVIFSKENTEDDEIVSPDNCSSALSILEVDGLFEREKANRVANPEYAFIARFDSVYQMNDSEHNNILGAVYEDEDEKAVIYHREYQIYDDCVLVNFVGTHDYVLKNYFTTVFARYRTYSYAGYDENVNRAETDKYLVFLSDDRCYYENDDNGLKQTIITSVLSAFSESVIDDDLNVQFPSQINCGYFTFAFNSATSKSYFSDVNQFVAGYSLCFNIKMYDNMTNGSYVESINCWDNGTAFSSGGAEYVGSQLGWHKMPISETDGFVKEVGCYFGYFDVKEFYKSYINNPTSTHIYDNIFDLPHKNVNTKFSIGKKYNFCKDNKETIDFTLQYELVNQDNNVVTSEWLMKLTDFNNYIKLPVPKQINNRETTGIGCLAKFWSRQGNFNWGLLNSVCQDVFEQDQCIRISFTTTSVEQNNVLEPGVTFDGAISGYYTSRYVIKDGLVAFPKQGYASMKITLIKIVNVVRSGSDVTRLTVKVGLQTNFPYSSGQDDPGYPQETITCDVDFQRDTSVSDSYDFVYIGQIYPGPETVGLYPWWARSSSKYNEHESEESAYTRNCSLYHQANPYLFPKTMYVLVSDQEIEQQLVYEQLKLNDIPNNMAIVDTSNFSNIFNIQNDENGRPYIKYHCVDEITETEIPSGNEAKSVQYWYYDAEGDGYLHFVFGVNILEINNNVITQITDKKVFISTLKSRNTKVYNYLHREIGKVMNFAEAENATSYGQQLFTPNEDEEED